METMSKVSPIFTVTMKGKVKNKKYAMNNHAEFNKVMQSENGFSKVRAFRESKSKSCSTFALKLEIFYTSLHKPTSSGNHVGNIVFIYPEMKKTDAIILHYTQCLRDRWRWIPVGDIKPNFRFSLRLEMIFGNEHEFT